MPTGRLPSAFRTYRGHAAAQVDRAVLQGVPDLDDNFQDEPKPSSRREGLLGHDEHPPRREVGRRRGPLGRLVFPEPNLDDVEVAHVPHRSLPVAASSPGQSGPRSWRVQQIRHRLTSLIVA